ncbi:hypothetical protein B0H16DRAFT_1730100 [Mycena metata]|uniref:DUF3533 domain-containing protein n=1 Tax=Mycena metata TaxID=1033252 RepID=A0AAD7I997_9AGAR|nr:hypothetical protein B0H16DRAFT_1730100 [Mycena metata]
MPNPEKANSRRNSESFSGHTAQDADAAEAPAQPASHAAAPFSMQFLDNSPVGGEMRAAYLKTMFGGTLALSIVIFAIFSIYWGSLWKTPLYFRGGSSCDFDGGMVGQGVVQALSAIDPMPGGISWSVVPASQFPGGVAQLEDAILREDTWYGLAINAGASANLTAAIPAADETYNSSAAATFIGSEARMIYPELKLTTAEKKRLEFLNQKSNISEIPEITG